MFSLFVAGCTREAIPVIEEKEESIVTINVAISPETRVAYEDSNIAGIGGTLSWQTDDVLLLAGYDGTTFKGYEDFTYSGTGNKFTGFPVVGATTYKAYYPGDIITLDGDGNVDPLDAGYWQQTQDGDGTTEHLRYSLFLYDETPNAIGEPFSLSLKSSILKLVLSGIPQQVGNLNQLSYTVETASGVFKSVVLYVSNVTFSSDKTSLTAYIPFDPTVMTGIIAGGTANITLFGDKSYKWSTQVSTAKNYSAGNRYTGTVTTGWNEIINPLSYFAEHNMADLNDTFEPGHNASGLYLFNWNDAMTYNTTPATHNGKSYYLPTIQEWRAIIPESNTYVNFTSTDTRTLSNAAVTVGGKSYTMSGTFENIDNVVYATLTYTHQSDPTLYAIARYQLYNMGYDNPYARMLIDMQSSDTPYTIDEAKNADWYSVGVISRVFPAAGWRDNNGNLSFRGWGGSYWSSTGSGGTDAMYMNFYNFGHAMANGNYSHNGGFSVRLVSRE